LNELEIDLIQATMWPGDTLAGVVRIDGPGDPLVHLTFQGEEVLSANSMAFHYVLPFFELSATLDCSSGPADFHFALPEQLPPSYFSTDLRCHYVLKARRKNAATGLIPGFRRDAIQKMHIPVLPTENREGSEQHWAVLRAGGAELELRLDSIAVDAGSSLAGELLLKQVNDGPMPTALTFRFAAIEEVTKKGYFHRKVVSLQTHDVKPEKDMEFPIGGFFEFPLPPDSPTSGEWHTFRVHYGFRVGMSMPDGTQVRESLPINVFRYPRDLPQPAWPERGVGLNPIAEH
jgi:hypothetical protein